MESVLITRVNIELRKTCTLAIELAVLNYLKYVWDPNLMLETKQDNYQ